MGQIEELSQINAELDAGAGKQRTRVLENCRLTANEHYRGAVFRERLPFDK
jgi:hypothetical protein